MPQELACSCTLCGIEAQLLSELALTDPVAIRQLFASHPFLSQHSSVLDLLSHLKTLPPDGRSDDLLRALFALRLRQTRLVEPLLVLAFVPMLHRTVHLVTKQQFALSPEDTAQEALSFFLEFVRSHEMCNRRSHFAFAIAREVKRHVFTWAERESRRIALLDELNGELQLPPDEHSSLERLTDLRHFLHRCVTNGMLTNAELHSLVEFKLNGGNANEIGVFNGTSANAVRQKFKRLLARLRLAAQGIRGKRRNSR
jgi:hypothetical protein